MHPIDHGFLAHFFTWRGRLNRMRHCKRQMAAFGLMCAAMLLLNSVIDLLSPHVRYSESVTWIIIAFIVLVVLAYTVSSVMLQIRRLHDLNLSGFFLLLRLVPFVDVIICLYLTFAKGTTGDNRFGHDPLGPAAPPAPTGAPPAEKVPAVPPPDARKQTAPIAQEAPAAVETAPGGGDGWLPAALISRAGRLARRGFALRMAALLGGSGLAFLLLEVFGIPLIYYAATLFFRDATAAFWVMMLGARIISSAAFWCIQLALALPTVIRRLHDMNRSGRWALPLVPATLILLCCAIALLLLTGAFIVSLLTYAGYAGVIDGIDTNSINRFLGLPMGITLAVYIILFPLLAAYAAWLFFKQGSPGENRYGPPPAREKMPPVRTAFFSAQGTIARGPFILRSLVLLAAAGAVLPFVAYLVTVPISLILIGLDVLPFGAHMYAFSCTVDLYPLAALPLVLRRLRTLGRSPYEAILVFAALIPIPFALVPLARSFGVLQLIAFAHNVPASDIIGPLTVAPTTGSLAFAAFSMTCAFISAISIIRLVRK